MQNYLMGQPHVASKTNISDAELFKGTVARKKIFSDTELFKGTATRGEENKYSRCRANCQCLPVSPRKVCFFSSHAFLAKDKDKDKEHSS
jgi:hypothetical protein